MSFNAGAEAVQSVEGNMSGAVMRGTVALPGSETSSRTNGSRRNLGDLLPPAAAQGRARVGVGSSAGFCQVSRQAARLAGRGRAGRLRLWARRGTGMDCVAC